MNSDIPGSSAERKLLDQIRPPAAKKMAAQGGECNDRQSRSFMVVEVVMRVPERTPVKLIVTFP